MDCNLVPNFTDKCSLQSRNLIHNANFAGFWYKFQYSFSGISHPSQRKALIFGCIIEVVRPRALVMCLSVCYFKVKWSKYDQDV